MVAGRKENDEALWSEIPERAQSFGAFKALQPFKTFKSFRSRAVLFCGTLNLIRCALT
jgi:hypothetical protein